MERLLFNCFKIYLYYSFKKNQQEKLCKYVHVTYMQHVINREFIAEFNRRKERWTLYYWRNERIENDVNEYRNALMGPHIMQIFRHFYANVAQDQKQFRNIRQNFSRSPVRHSYIWCM